MRISCHKKKNKKASIHLFLQLPDKSLLASYKIAQLLVWNENKRIRRKICYCTSSARYCWNYDWNWCCRESEQSSIIKWCKFTKDWRVVFRQKKKVREHFDAENQLPLLRVLHPDESTDVTGKAHLLAHTRFIKKKNLQTNTCFAKNWETYLEGRLYLIWWMKNFVFEVAVEEMCLSVFALMDLSKEKIKDCYVRAAKQPKVLVVVHRMTHNKALVSKALPTNSVMSESGCSKGKLHKISTSSKSTFFWTLRSDGFGTRVFVAAWGGFEWKVLNRVCHLKPEIFYFVEIQKKILWIFHSWWTLVVEISFSSRFVRQNLIV